MVMTDFLIGSKAKIMLLRSLATRLNTTLKLAPPAFILLFKNCNLFQHFFRKDLLKI